MPYPFTTPSIRVNPRNNPSNTPSGNMFGPSLGILYGPEGANTIINPMN